MTPLFLPTREAGMRSSKRATGSLFSYFDLEDRVPAKHPLRVILPLLHAFYTIRSETQLMEQLDYNLL
jgi:hypothetical protein